MNINKHPNAIKQILMGQLLQNYNAIAEMSGKPPAAKFDDIDLTFGAAVPAPTPVKANSAPVRQKRPAQKKSSAKLNGFKKISQKAKPAPSKSAASAPTPLPPTAEKRKGERRGQGIGALAMSAIIAGKTNEEILKLVKEKFPDAKTSVMSLTWYRGQIRAKLKASGAL